MSDATLSELEASNAEQALPLMDEDTFRRFYERTSRGLWAYLSRMTGDRQLADDLVQETYYRFYRAGASYESETHRRNALFCIATNVMRDAARRRRHAELVPLPEHDLTGDERTASRVEGRTDLSRAMEHLKPMQRQMLWLAYAQGASHHEIAEIFGLKSASIKLLLFRARRKLAGLLQRRAS
ncbi:MAG TPA: RNA polymerase sigma factor [Thermoanaerobaculia bacterium]|nr:RNA polymerase sigma factor [Thermoanaerobaculia bacterium]